MISAHADPLHAIALEQACDSINRDRGVVSIAPMGAVFGGSMGHCRTIRKKQERFPNDFHAGWIETSCMLELFPELVKESYHGRPAVSITDRDMMDAEIVCKAIKGEGHIGFPAEADA